MHRLFGLANEKMREILGGTTIADIVEEGGPFDYSSPKAQPEDSNMGTGPISPILQQGSRTEVE